MRVVISEIREVEEYEGSYGTSFQNYCVVTDEASGEQYDVRIDAQKDGRWKVGDIVELEDKGKKPWERDGIAYTLVKAQIPEDLRQGGGGGQRNGFRNGGGNRQQSAPARSPFGGGNRSNGNGNGNGSSRGNQNDNAPQASRPTVPAAKPAMPYAEAQEILTRIETLTDDPAATALLFRAVLDGKVLPPMAPGEDVDDNIPFGQNA